MNFDTFIGILCSFKTKSLEDKIDRFFKLIDEDGNGMLSYDEIFNLCQRSFKTFEDDTEASKNVNDGSEGDEFFLKLSEYFAHFIFKCVHMDPS